MERCHGEEIAQFTTPPGTLVLMRFSADGRKLCVVTIVEGEPDEAGAQEDCLYTAVW